MTILEHIVYGLISGVSEFLPVSTLAHQNLLRYLFGVETRNSLQELLVHMGVLLSIFVGARDVISRLREEQKSLASTRRRKRSMKTISYYDLRLLKTAAVPLLIGMLLHIVTSRYEGKLLTIVLFSLISATVLLIAEHLSRGNRDARTMTGLDGIVMGIAGALSAFPGISRMGMISAYAMSRGADSKNVANWATLLALPALLFLVCFDLFGIVTVGVGALSFGVVIGYLLSGIAGFCGGLIGISIIKMVLNDSGFSGFAYYSIGTALFSFILYLIT